MEGHAAQSFYGSVTVGERGQVVIPLAAREALGLKPGDKLLVASGPMGPQGLLMIKAEAISELMNRFTSRISELERLLQSTAEQQPDKDS